MPSAEHILLAEDDRDYVYFIELACEDAGLSNPVQVVRNGREAIRYLKGKGPCGDRLAHPLPAVVLLDLTTGRLSSLVVLRWIRRQPELEGLPVVVLADDVSAHDARAAYKLGADSVVAKPCQFLELRKLLEAVCASWLQRSSRP